MVIRLVQLEKALLPIKSTLLGISTEVRAVQPEKALSSIPHTPSFSTKLFRAMQPSKALPSMLPFVQPEIVAVVSPVQFLKAYIPIPLVTVAGTVTPARPEQPWKA